MERLKRRNPVAKYANINKSAKHRDKKKDYTRKTKHREKQYV